MSGYSSAGLIVTLFAQYQVYTVTQLNSHFPTQNQIHLLSEF